MKWIVRIICFALTTAIYIPIESALSKASTSKVLIGLITAIIYFFLYYIPSRAIIATLGKRNNNGSSTLTTEEETTTSSFYDDDIVYFISTGDGSIIRIPESHMDNYYAKQTSKLTVQKSKRLCLHLWATAIKCALRISFPRDYFTLTYIWNILYCSILDIAELNQVNIMMDHQYNLHISSLLANNPNRSRSIEELKEFQRKTYSYISKSFSSTPSFEDIRYVLNLACAPILSDDGSRTSFFPSLTPEMVEEVSSIIEDTTEYAINLFHPYNETEDEK